MNTATKSAPPTLVLRRVIHAKRDRVFEAWSNPEIMSKWFYPGVGKAIVTNSFRLGGSFENTMVLSSTTEEREGCDSTSESNTYVHTGEYLEIIPPERIVFTWNSPFVKDSRVIVELRDLGESTELTLTHELLETEDLRQKHNDGWEGCLKKLANYLG